MGIDYNFVFDLLIGEAPFSFVFDLSILENMFMLACHKQVFSECLARVIMIKLWSCLNSSLLHLDGKENILFSVVIEPFRLVRCNFMNVNFRIQSRTMIFAFLSYPVV